MKKVRSGSNFIKWIKETKRMTIDGGHDQNDSKIHREACRIDLHSESHYRAHINLAFTNLTSSIAQNCLEIHLMRLIPTITVMGVIKRFKTQQCTGST